MVTPTTSEPSVGMDPVAERLASAGEEQAPSVVEWLDGQHQRGIMRRRAGLCVLSGWLLIVAAAVVSSGVALYMSHDVREILSEEFAPESGPPLSLLYVPTALIVFTFLVIFGGVAAWAVERVPGFSRTVSAIDWSAVSDAVTRLLLAGCTYPEAFRTAAKASTCKLSRHWLIGAAERVERGGAELTESSRSQSVGDAAVLELLVDASDSPPQQQWKVAADHFFVVAQRRLTLLLQTTPMIATILSGMIVWLAISVTLGWMWRAVGQMMNEMGGGNFW